MSFSRTATEPVMKAVQLNDTDFTDELQIWRAILPCLSSDGHYHGGQNDKVLGLDSGKVRLNLHGDDSPVTSLCISSDGRNLFSSSQDKKIRCWDALSSSSLNKSSRHTNQILNEFT